MRGFLVIPPQFASDIRSLQIPGRFQRQNLVVCVSRVRHLISIPRVNVTYCSSWRHWGCVTPKIIENVKKNFESAEDLDGFDDLTEEDQQKLNTAWEVGHVAEEDVPPTAKKADGEEEKPKKRASKKKVTEDEGEEEEEKPKKARGRKPKVSRICCPLL